MSRSIGDREEKLPVFFSLPVFEMAISTRLIRFAGIGQIHFKC